MYEWYIEQTPFFPSPGLSWGWEFTFTSFFIFQQMAEEEAEIL
jgi:hypothetical protein